MQIALHIPEKLTADIALPASKSVSNRALLLQALCPVQHHTIDNLAVCDDTDHMVQGIAAKQQGASLIDIGATGTAMRFLTAYLAITEGETTITGSERMQQRPIGTLVEALRTLGADITYTGMEGYPPLRIKGKQLRGGELEIEAGISSQYISALLMIAPHLTEGLILHLKGRIASRTYIELTLDLMRKYGAVAEWTDEQTIRIWPGNYEDIPLTVEGDWSAASYWYELAAVAAHKGHEVDMLLRGLTRDSRQGDRVVAEMFEPLGVTTEYTDKGARIKASSLLKVAEATLLCEAEASDVANDAPLRVVPRRGDSGLSKDLETSKAIGMSSPVAVTPPREGLGEASFTHCPDIAQTLAVTCCLLNIPYIFKGIHSLRIKETDRVAALIAELRKLGFILRTEGDECLVWDGTRCKPDENPVIATYDDHRMAMAFAPTALYYEGLTIEHPEVVTKSYPNFWRDLKTIEN